jgi:hypothetical protein
VGNPKPVHTPHTTSLSATSATRATSRHDAREGSQSVGGRRHTQCMGSATTRWQCIACQVCWTTDRSRRMSPCPHCRCMGESLPPPGKSVQERFPELASEARGWDPWDVWAGANARLTWLCPDCGDEYVMQVAQRTGRGSGCGSCAPVRRTRPRPGESLAETHPHAVNDVSGWDPLRYRANFREPLDWRCHHCGFRWRDSPKTYTKAKRPCPDCRRRDAHFPAPGNSIADSPFADEAYGWDPALVAQGSNRNMTWRCARGHVWEARPLNRTRQNTGCSECHLMPAPGQSLAETHPELAQEMLDEDPWRYTAGSMKRVMWRIADCGHSWGPVPISSRARKGTGCGVCSGKTVVSGVNDILTLAPAVGIEAHGWDATRVHPGSKKSRPWRCSTCSHTWETAPAWRMRGSGCSQCAERGYQASKRGYLYLITNWRPGQVTPEEEASVTYVKVGISNVLNQRLGSHFGTGFVHILDVRAHSDGAAILELERLFKRAAGRQGWRTAKQEGHRPFDGYTETIVVDDSQTAQLGPLNRWTLPDLLLHLGVEKASYWPTRNDTGNLKGGRRTVHTRALEYVEVDHCFLRRRNPKKGKARLAGSEPVGLTPAPSTPPGEDPILAWTPGLAAVTSFSEIHGHARVPVRHWQAGFPLGAWVIKQRQAYRQDRLSATRISLLESLPDWSWNVADDRWRDTYAVLQRAVDKEGRAKFPTNYELDGVNLSSWCAAQRRKYHKNKLTTDKVEALAGLPGWYWSIRKSKLRRPQA